MANRRFIDFPIASTVGDSDIILIWQSGANKQTTKATFLSGLPENLDELNDVAISGLTNGQILRYDSVTGKWENTDQGNLDLNDLNDVSIVSPSNGQVLVYNSSTNKWENSSGGYVPYTGAVTTVNLGAQSILAGSFVKAGGTSAQFLKANGSVDSNVYGTGTVTSVALTMPTAFSVAGSPITTAGTLAVTGAGDTTQYIAGDGTLVAFPISGQAGTLVREVRNNTGATLTKGTVVYINGATGNKPTVAKAIATGDTTSAQTFGLLQADIANNANGFIVAFGDLDGLDTFGIAEGSQLYLSATVAGGYTTVKQYAPNHLVYIGVVTRAHPTDGRIEVRIQNGYEMDELHNVAAQSPDNNDILQYKTSTSLWTKVAGLTTNIAEGTNLYYTEARVNANTNVAANTAARHNAVTIGTANGLSLSTQVLSLGLASAGVTGALSGTDWSTFNGKQNALTNPVTGTGTTNYLPKFTGASTIGNSILSDSGTRLTQNSGDGFAISTSSSDTVGAGSFLALTNLAQTRWMLQQLNASFGLDWWSFNGTAWSPRMQLTAGGNLLVGTTTDAGFKLDVNGTGRFSGALTINGDLNFNSAGGTTYLNINQGTGADGGIILKRANSNRWQIAQTISGDNIVFYSYGTSNDVLRLNYSTGAATFSSSVTANGNIFSQLSTANDISLLINPTATAVRISATYGTTGSYQPLTFSTSDTERMRITSGGNVLIGNTTDNGARLQVNGNSNFSSAPSLGGYQVQALSNSGGSTSYGGVIVQSVNGKAGYLTCGDNSTSTWYGAQASFVTLGATLGAGIKLRVNADDNTGLAIGTNGIIDMAGPLVVRGTLPADQTDAAVIDHFSNTMRIFSYGAAGVTGDFQFRTAAGGAGSNLVSTINGTTGVYVAVSDINKKKDFEQSTIGLDAILGLKPTLYRMKNDNSNSEKELGFIAQEVKDYIKQAYVEKDDFIGLNYNSIIPVLVKAIQELNEKIK
jgi:hypothetical protein